MKMPFFAPKNGTEPQEDPNSFGNIAVEKGYITPDKLREAVRVQQERLPLGEILVSMGVLTTYQRDEILLEQRFRKMKGKSSPNRIAAQELERQRLQTQSVKSTLEEMLVVNSKFVESYGKK